MLNVSEDKKLFLVERRGERDDIAILEALQTVNGSKTLMIWFVPLFT